MQWQWMPFQYLWLNNMSIFCTFQHPQYGFMEDCGRRGWSISRSPIMDISKLVATTGSSDCWLSHKTSSNTQNIVSAKQLRKNSPTTETEAGGICISVLQGRAIQGESADLIIQAWRQSAKKQYECYLRKWFKFSGYHGVDEVIPLDQPRREASSVIRRYDIIHETWYCTPDQVTFIIIVYAYYIPFHWHDSDFINCLGL